MEGGEIKLAPPPIPELLEAFDSSKTDVRPFIHPSFHSFVRSFLHSRMPALILPTPPLSFFTSPSSSLSSSSVISWSLASPSSHENDDDDEARKSLEKL
jgi:hypothetical protein